MLARRKLWLRFPYPDLYGSNDDMNILDILALSALEPRFALNKEN